MEEDANTLKKHFAIVDDFFKKTFREECKFFIGLKTTQRADTSKVSVFSTDDEDKVKGDRLTSVQKESTSTRVLPPSSVLTHAKGPVLVALPVDKKNGRENTLAGGSSNFFAVSPRLQYFTSGETLGKLKLICGLTIPRMCHLEQDVALSSNGMIRGQMKVSDLMEGLKINGRIGLNTITSAAEDASSLGFSYLRSDMFSSVLYQRNGLGSSNVAVDFGSKFLNLLAGAGFERSKLSFVEAESGVEEIKAMYVGGGFTGLNWSIGAKCTHANGAWSNGRVAVMQKLRPSTTAVCSYDLDMAKSFAIISLGFSQGMVLRLPHFLSPTNSSSRLYSGAPTFSGTPAGVLSSSSINGASRSDLENDYSRSSGNALPLVFPLISHVPLVFALKGESTGKVSATIRTIFNNSIRCGLVAHYNILWKNSKPRLGVIISLEQEAS